MKYEFDVETKEAGQRRSYGDSHYHYLVTSPQAEHIVKLFCMKVLQQSYPKDEMPNAFAGKLVKFEKITDNAKGSSGTKIETYEYKVTSMYTG